MRLPTGGSEIDRGAPIRFRFDDVEYEGFAGDTIASALLANDVRVVGRGIYTGRPRGVFTAGSEEPNAIVQVRWPSGTSEPSLRATVVEIADGMEAWSLAGRGRLEGEDRGRFDRKYVHVETLVVGGGAAGRAAAAATRDGRVLLVDEGPVIEPIEGVQVVPRATALGIYDHGYVLVAERRPEHRTEGRLWHIRADRIVLATGALERPIPFPGNDRPGVMLASAAAAYVERFGVLPARSFALATTNDSGYASASVLQAAGAELVKVVDLRRGERVDGSEAELLLVSGGWNPNLALWSQARRPTAVRRPDRRLRPGWRAAKRRGRRNSHRRRATGQLRPDVGRQWRRGHHVRRPGTGCHRGRHPASAGRRADLDRARQALHDDRHRQRPGQDRRGAGKCRRRGAARPGAGCPRRPDVPPALRAGLVRAAGRPGSRCPPRPGPDHLDPRLARRARGGVRGRGPVEAAALLPARRRVDGRGGAARGSGGSPFRGGDGRLDPRQDRPPGPGRRHLPRPHLYEPLLEPGRRRVPLRADVPSRRHGLR